MTPSKKTRSDGTTAAGAGTPKRPAYPGTGGVRRRRTQSFRTRLLLTDVTPKEKEQIIKHCLKRKISVSHYLAELALADARKSDDRGEEALTIKLPKDQMRKLLLLARVTEKTTEELIPELLSPRLAKKQPHGSLETETLRSYVNPEEHEAIMKHVASKGISARNYISMLALEDIAKESKSTSKSQSRKRK